MARRCPDCNKFVSLEPGDPEVQNIEMDDGGHITADVRIVNQCADCSTELTEANVEMESEVKLANHECGAVDIDEEYKRRIAAHEKSMEHYRNRISKIGEYVRAVTPNESEHFGGGIAYIEIRPGGTFITYHAKSMRDLQKLAGVPSDVLVSDYDVCGPCEPDIVFGNYVHTNDIHKITEKRELPCKPHGNEWCKVCYKPLVAQPPEMPDDPVDEEPEFDLEETNVESSDKMEGKGRYAKHFYGAIVDYTVKCSRCGEEVATGQMDGYVQASYMEDMG